MKCPDCGGEAERLYVAEPIAFFRCSACGKQIEVLRTPTPAPDHAGHQRLRVWVAWKGKTPTAREIVALKKLAPEFADISLEEVKKRLSGVRVWDFGAIWDVDAQDLIRRGRELGLEVNVEAGGVEH